MFKMQISPLHAGETWIRKDVIITQNEKDLLCKMWNENADKEMKVGRQRQNIQRDCWKFQSKNLRQQHSRNEVRGMSYKS